MSFSAFSFFFKLSASQISAFVTPYDLGQYKVMAFGMQDASATFCRLVKMALKGVTGCEAKLDNLVIYSSTWSQHIIQLEEVFARQVAANLTVTSPV